MKYLTALKHKLHPIKMLHFSLVYTLTIVKFFHVGIVKVGYSFRGHSNSSLELAFGGGVTR